MIILIGHNFQHSLEMFIETGSEAAQMILTHYNNANKDRLRYLHKNVIVGIAPASQILPINIVNCFLNKG